MITFHGCTSGGRIAILDKSSVAMIVENIEGNFTEITFKEGADSEYGCVCVKEDFNTVCNTILNT